MSVGIVIPAYNGASCISRAIASVLAQTISDWQLVVVDDGSTDGTARIVKEYAQKDARITYMYQENSGGPAKPFNIGIRHLDTEYIALLEQDDEWLPEKLEEQIGFLGTHSHIGAVGCGVLMRSSKKKNQSVVLSRNMSSADEWKRSLLEAKNFFPNLSTLVLRKDKYKSLPLFDERFSVAADVDFYITVMDANFYSINRPLSVYYANDTSLSKNKNSLKKLIDDELLLFQKYSELFGRHHQAYAKRLGYAGVSLLLLGRWRGGFNCLRHSLILKPAQPLLWVKIAMVVLFRGKGYYALRNAYFTYIKYR